MQIPAIWCKECNLEYMKSVSIYKLQVFIFTSPFWGKNNWNHVCESTLLETVPLISP